MTKRYKNTENGNGNGGNNGNGNSNGNNKKLAGFTAANEYQKAAIKVIHENQATILYGPAGTGKTHIAVGYGVQHFLKLEYERLIFTRPCVEAYGENLGFLPGDTNQKIAPYMIPIFDIMQTLMHPKDLDMFVREGAITTVPLAFMRGMTFNNAFVIADEFQNARKEQVRLFLTRIGKNCKIVVTGDITQSDIGPDNGLADAIGRFKNAPGFGIIELPLCGSVRSPIIEVVENRYASNQS